MKNKFKTIKKIYKFLSICAAFAMACVGTASIIFAFFTPDKTVEILINSIYPGEAIIEFILVIFFAIPGIFILARTKNPKYLKYE
jgi:hypothetical protein